MKRALITGITGQDGAYLADYLLKKGYQVYGTYRRTSSPNFWRLLSLGVYDQVKLVPIDMTDMASLIEAVSIARPAEVYNLAAQSFVAASFEKPLFTADVDGLGSVRLLEAIRLLDLKIKFYQASSSEIYGNVKPRQLPINEQTPMRPASPYAAAKLYAYDICRIYRESYGIFAVNGILFNHESPLRGLEFVTRKISNAVAQIAHGRKKYIEIGNLNAKRDWGYAPEYVDAMWRMLQNKTLEDFVIATNEFHSVGEFLIEAFKVAGLGDPDKYVRSKQKFMRLNDVNSLLGDYSKAKKILKWQPKVKYKELVRIMVEADLERWDRYLRGEMFPWDAPNFPHEANIISRSLKV